METWGAADDRVDLTERARHAWLTCLSFDTGRFPKYEPGFPDCIFCSGAPPAIQFNFSRIIMTLLKLTPVTEIQIKFGQSCKDDSWILFILSDGGLAGRVGTQRGREKGSSLCCAWTLLSVSCWEKPHRAVSGVTSTGCAQISGTRTILLSSNDPEGEDIYNYLPTFHLKEELIVCRSEHTVGDEKSRLSA